MRSGKKLGIIAAAGAECAGAAIVFQYFFCRLRAFDPVYETLYLQKTAYNTLFLFFHGWREYATHYLRLAFSGEATLRDWTAGCGHLNLLMNIIMGTALRLFPAPETVFFLNGVMIYSAVPFVYCYGRQRKLPEGAQFGFRLSERAKTDLKFQIRLSRSGESPTKEVSFANGLRPADTVEPGTVFFVQLPPLSGGAPEQIRVQVISQ